MPAVPDSDFITQAQYNQYSAVWLELLNSGNTSDLQQAFQAPHAAARINFLSFSIDQILALVSAAGATRIKARFLLMPDATGQACFSITLFAVDANDQPLSAYYIPTQSAATTTQAVAPSGGRTQITPAVARHWLTDWVEADALATAMFTTSHGPLHGFNFEVSTFQDPLAEAQPYAGKCLFLNLGLGIEAGVTLSALVVYIGQMGSRTQGNLDGIPEDGDFYDRGDPCPPSP